MILRQSEDLAAASFPPRRNDLVGPNRVVGLAETLCDPLVATIGRESCYASTIRRDRARWHQNARRPRLCRSGAGTLACARACCSPFLRSAPLPCLLLPLRSTHSRWLARGSTSLTP